MLKPAWATSKAGLGVEKPSRPRGRRAPKADDRCAELPRHLQNNTVGEQLGWLVQQGHVGTAIWDASLSAAEWRQKSVWEQLKAIKAR